MSRLYALLAGLLAALAALHMATTWRLTSATAFTKVWFFGTGIAMAQAAALNLLHRRYGAGATGLRWVTRASNAATLGIASVAGWVTGASPGELALMLGLLAALLLLSFTRGSVAAGAPV